MFAPVEYHASVKKPEWTEDPKTAEPKNDDAMRRVIMICAMASDTAPKPGIVRDVGVDGGVQ